VTLTAVRGGTADSYGPFHFPVWIIGFFTLWDFYYAGVRPFDHLGFLLLIFMASLQLARPIAVEQGGKFLFILVVVLWLVVVGSLQHADTWKPATGMIEGALVGILIAISQFRKGEIIRLLELLILIHCLALLLQFSLYTAFHYTLNYQAWTGVEIRTFALSGGIRPTGLFQEPAEVCLMLFSLISLYKMHGGKSLPLELLALGCMALSLSLWGWAADLFYLVVFRPRWAFVVLPFLVAAAVYLIAHFNLDDPQAGFLTVQILARFLGPHTDPSTQSRYGGLFRAMDTDVWKLWFGTGVTNDYLAFGANGLGFILTAGGIVGLLIFLCLWAVVLPWGRKVQGLLALSFMLSAATQWTFIWWWVWPAIAAIRTHGPSCPRQLT
jgi:hypothetical protein